MGQLLDHYKLSNNPDFIGLVSSAVLRVAMDIRNTPVSIDEPTEPGGGLEPAPPTSGQLDVRRKFADYIYANSYTYDLPPIRQFARLVAADQAIRTAGIVNGIPQPGSIPDLAVLNLVSAEWDNVAGQL
jgi:hypothetical protein